ncbi:hypothetical protein ACWDYJ_07285 [Streptomyces sp. NPDC003042]
MDISGYAGRTVLLAAAVSVLCACGATAARQDGAARAAEAFERALAAGDHRAACDLLAPQSREELEENEEKGCAQALEGQRLPPGGAVEATDVYGRQAMLRLAGDTLFLSQFSGGWKIVAAGCTARPGAPDKPYKCSVKGA